MTGQSKATSETNARDNRVTLFASYATLSSFESSRSASYKSTLLAQEKQRQSPQYYSRFPHSTLRSTACLMHSKG